MRDRVDESVVLFVAPDLADQKRGVEHHANDDRQSQQRAEEQQDAGVPAQQHPADVQQNDDRDQPDAERDEECDGPAASGNNHNSRVR